jgi:hypothetical protein
LVRGGASLQLHGRYSGLQEARPSKAVIMAQSACGARFKFGHSDYVGVLSHSASATPPVTVSAVKGGGGAEAANRGCTTHTRFCRVFTGGGPAHPCHSDVVFFVGLWGAVRCRGACMCGIFEPTKARHIPDNHWRGLADEGGTGRTSNWSSTALP